jgi:hypothetical protein
MRRWEWVLEVRRIAMAYPGMRMASATTDQARNLGTKMATPPFSELGVMEP